MLALWWLPFLKQKVELIGIQLLGERPSFFLNGWLEVTKLSKLAGETRDVGSLTQDSVLGEFAPRFSVTLENIPWDICKIGI